MHDRRALIIHGLKVFALSFGLMETVGYLNRNPAASTSDLVTGQAVAFAICAGFGLVAAYALKHTGNDVDA